MLTTRGLGPGPLLPTAGLGPFGGIPFVFEPGVTFTVPEGDVTFTPFPGTVLFKPSNLETVFEVRTMYCTVFEVPAGKVTFTVRNTAGKKFVVPKGALGKVFKPK